MNDRHETRLTDYALGELDEAGRLEVEALLAVDPAARAEVDELRRLSGILRAGISSASTATSPPAPAHDAALRAAVAARVGQSDDDKQVVEPKRRSILVERWPWFVGSGVATILLAALLLPQFQPVRESGRANTLATVSGRANRPETSSNSSAIPTGATSGVDQVAIGGESRYPTTINVPPIVVSTPPFSGPIADPKATQGPLGSTVAGIGSLIVPTENYDANPDVLRPVPTISFTGATIVASPGSSTIVPPSSSNTYSAGTTISGGTLMGIGVVSGVVSGIGIASPQGGELKAANTSKAEAELYAAKLFPLLVKQQQLTEGGGSRHPQLPEVERQIAIVTAQLEKLRNNGNQSGITEGMTHDPVRTFNTEAYDSFAENPFLKPVDAPLSTFSIDVDTASYSNMRRFLKSGHLPPRGSVRIEEFINYFTYNYPQPTKDDPFSVTTETIDCPWNAEHVLLRVGLKGREIAAKERPATNLVFLVDVSGSMQDANKLPLVRESLKLLVRELNDRDRVALVVYAGRTAVVLPSTGGDRKQSILDAIDSLQSGGSTNGGAGIALAYQMAVDHFLPGGVNRVVLATDGDFNVGVTNQDELVRLVEEKAKSGVFFSALGYGMGNLKDSTLEKLADKGNGNYAYIDTLQEARKVLVEQMSGTLVTIAKDVKIQIEFNPAKVVAYRLLGYENRALTAQDFNDDKKDAGEIGAGHTVTALYELALVGTSVIQVQEMPKVDPLKYQQPKRPLPKNSPVHDELLTLKLRYKAPDGTESKLIERPVKNAVKPYAKAGVDFKFASAVAAFGMLLRQSEHRGSATYDAVLEMAQEGVGRDENGYRKEFVALVRQARDMAKQ